MPSENPWAAPHSALDSRSKQTRSVPRTLAGLVGAVTLPFIFDAAYVIWCHERAPNVGVIDPWVDLAFLVVCFGSGVGSLSLLPIARGWRVVLSLMYIPLLVGLLIVFDIYLQGALYEEWL